MMRGLKKQPGAAVRGQANHFNENALEKRLTRAQAAKMQATEGGGGGGMNDGNNGNSRRTALGDATNRAGAGAAAQGALAAKGGGGVQTRRQRAMQYNGVVGTTTTQQRQQQALQQQQAAAAQLHMADDVEPMAEEEDLVEDIDAYDADSPQCCTEYVSDVMEYLFSQEFVATVDARYMDKQVDINAGLRDKLMNWMVGVCLKYRLLSETMFLAAGIVDRFLALKPVSRYRLQLVGVTAVMIASKVEELWAPYLKDFVYVTQNAFSKEELLKMERIILATLDYQLGFPVPLHFVRRFSKAARSDSKTHTLSKYLTELSIPSYAMLQFRPSQIAASAVLLARAMTNQPHWNATLEYYAGYTKEEIMPCVHALNGLVADTSNSWLVTTRKKYSSTKLFRVSKMPPASF